MILHDIDYKNFQIINVDTLENDAIFADEKYTIQVANPPYSTKWSADARFMDDERYSPYGKLAPKTKADFAFVQHMVYHMANGDSRIAVLLPHGVLFRGAAEGTIRKYLIDDLNVIDAIIGLPANCFQGTSIPVCCMVLKKERNGNSGNICFIDASKEFEKGKQQNYITDEHIEKIVSAYSNREDIEKYCHIATMEEIRENDFNLNIPRYVDTTEEEPEVDLKQLSSSIRETNHAIKEGNTTLLNMLNELTFNSSETKDAVQEFIKVFEEV